MDFGRIAFDAILAFPFAGPGRAFKERQGAFFQVFSGNFGKVAVHDDTVPFGAFFPFAGGFILPAFGGRNGQGGHLGLVGREPYLRVIA